jgi:dihydroorotate dehydrogenase (NAD+) catalytic subunit
MVYEVFKAVKIPIIGMGGIMNADDALEFIFAGAAAIAVGTANFIHPVAAVDILEGITAYGEQEEVAHIRSLTGAAHAD